MSCRAILHSTGKESIPLLLVRSGELTPRQCDHEFKGMTGECPTCKAMIESADFGDGSSFAQAMLSLQARGQTVGYKRFGYGSSGNVEPWRVCYWGHPPGYWDGVEFRNCQSASRSAHTVHLEVIKKFYAKNFSPDEGFIIKVEPHLRKPGDPPRPYSPDLAIYGRSGERLAAVEYQRSYESYEAFSDRDNLRREEGWAVVDWWFDDTQLREGNESPTVYTKSQMHRTHLALLSVYFYRCWVDSQTLKLQAEYGCAGDLPPARHRRVLRRIEKAELTDCSAAAQMRQFEKTPEWQIVKEFAQPLQAQKGSDLDFKAQVDWSLARQRQIALAVTKRTARLEEQDRRHRQWITEQAQKATHEKERSKTVEKAFMNDAAKISTKSNDHTPAALNCYQEETNEEHLRWGVSIGSAGHLVEWRRGSPFIGKIKSWMYGRPVVVNNKTGATRLAWDSSDYRIIV